MSRLLCFLLYLSLPTLAVAASPKCDGPDNWAAMSAYGKLKNAALVDNALVDFKKTKVTRIASELIGKDLYRQVHRVTYTFFSGKTVEVITINDASHEECSMTGVEVFVVSGHMDADASGL
jgi:hypothetical protein